MRWQMNFGPSALSSSSLPSATSKQAFSIAPGLVAVPQLAGKSDESICFPCNRLRLDAGRATALLVLTMSIRNWSTVPSDWRPFRSKEIFLVHNSTSGENKRRELAWINRDVLSRLGACSLLFRCSQEMHKPGLRQRRQDSSLLRKLWPSPRKSVFVTPSFKPLWAVPHPNWQLP